MQMWTFFMAGCKYSPRPVGRPAVRFLSLQSGFLMALLLAGTAATACAAQTPNQAPKPTGAMVDLGGHKLHVHCAGTGAPTVIIENGFQEYSFDWILVQQEVAKFTRVCTYDRAGYAWSDPGPKPRTFAQINLELHDALEKLGEHGPFVLVGHSFGGPVARNFALRYPKHVAGMVFAEGVSEDQRIPINNKAVLLREGGGKKTIPEPREEMRSSDMPGPPTRGAEQASNSVDPPFDRLPANFQALHLWADKQPAMEDAINSESSWSPEYFARWHSRPQQGTLGNIPLIVLTSANAGYGNDLDISGAQLEADRKEIQAQMALLSSNGKQKIVQAGHNLQVEDPAVVVQAIRDVVMAARK